MARIDDHLERLRQKPTRVRHRIAVATAGAFTALVAVGWMATLAGSGTLALRDTRPVEEAPDDAAVALSESASAFSNLVGAAGAALGATSTAAALRIIDERTSSTLDDAPPPNDTQETVIPF
jgi:hypothetical protein